MNQRRYSKGKIGQSNKSMAQAVRAQKGYIFKFKNLYMYVLGLRFY